MKKLLVIAVSLLCFNTSGIALGAEKSAQELSHEYNLDYQNWLRVKILKFPKKATVQLELKNHRIVRGVYLAYQKYDDSFWIKPLGKHGLFADDAYDISEILDVKLIVVRAI